MPSSSPEPKPRWMCYMLIAAGLYNLLWGVSALIAPNSTFDLYHLPRPIYPQIWQCLGMVIGVYGVGYLIAATDPPRHWPIVLVGLLGKIFGPIGYVYYAAKGDFPWSWGWLILFNDVMWWAPFGLILIRARRMHREHG